METPHVSSKFPARLLSGFVAGFLATLIFHQGIGTGVIMKAMSDWLDCPTPSAD